MNQLQPTVIVSANIGCITHLQSGSETPVRHWVEVLDACISHFGRADALCRWRPV
jgi:glycolate oxidase iron-sulfur subunit